MLIALPILPENKQTKNKGEDDVVQVLPASSKHWGG